MAGLNEIREQPSAGKMEEDCTGENRYPDVSRINIPQQRKKGIPNKKKELTQLRFIRELDELVESREDAGHSREWPRCPLCRCLRRRSPSAGTFQRRSEHTLWPKRPTYSNFLSPILLPQLAIFQNQENIYVNRDGRVAVTAKFEEINMTWELFRAESTVRRQ